MLRRLCLTCLSLQSATRPASTYPSARHANDPTDRLCVLSKAAVRKVPTPHITVQPLQPVQPVGLTLSVWSELPSSV